jgi:hypothetical protein
MFNGIQMDVKNYSGEIILIFDSFSFELSLKQPSVSFARFIERFSIRIQKI